MKKRWIAIYLLLLFLPYSILLILGKAGYFEEKPPQEEPPPAHTVRLYRHQEKAIEELPLDQYLWGVLAGEMPASYPEEALKAQVVASYSYLLHRKATVAAHPDADLGHTGDICDNPAHCKAYLSPEEAAEKWGEHWLTEAEPRLTAAVETVFGEALFYEDAPANAVFHSISGGRTEEARDLWGAEIPYLISVDSAWDKEAEGFTSHTEVPLQEFCNTLNIENPTLGSVTKTAGGSVASITLDGKEFSGPQIRTLFHLRSTRFTLKIQKDMALFTVEGYGHQVGMSQYGASVLAQNGYSYREILTYYYPGTSLKDSYFHE